MNVPIRILCLVAFVTIALSSVSTRARPRPRTPAAPSTTRDATLDERTRAEASLFTRLGVRVAIPDASMVSLTAPFDTLVAALSGEAAARLACSEIAYAALDDCGGDPTSVYVLVVPVDPAAWPNLFSASTVGENVRPRALEIVAVLDVDGDRTRELALVVTVEEPMYFTFDRVDRDQEPDRIDARGALLFVVTPGPSPSLFATHDVAVCQSSQDGERCRDYTHSVSDRDRNGRPELSFSYPAPRPPAPRPRRPRPRYEYEYPYDVYDEAQADEALEPRVFTYDAATDDIVESHGVTR